MSKAFLYRQIAESINNDILNQTLNPGDRLPSVRDMAQQWHCTAGTVQKAYEMLIRRGLVVSRPGSGTHVASEAPQRASEKLPLRRATLVNQTEAFLLEALTAGYSQAEIEQAFYLALDRWRAVNQQTEPHPESSLRFVGSHDPAVTLAFSRLPALAPDDDIPQLSFAGSLGGLIALAEGQADLAGVHLWDEESNTYNVPFAQRLLPGRKIALLTLAHRYLGLVVAPGNPKGVTGLSDLTQPDLRFINRQSGAGTRVWLDAHLRQLEITPQKIIGFETEAQTHSEVARAIAESQADAGLAVQAVALAFSLDFLPLTTERYDLVIPAEAWPHPTVQMLVDWLASADARQQISALGGYDVQETGQVMWLNKNNEQLIMNN